MTGLLEAREGAMDGARLRARDRAHPKTLRAQ
jgi:hypothetical protein